MELRRTTDDDLSSLHATFTAAIGGLYRPRGFTPPAPPAEVFASQQRHILATGSSTVAVDGTSVLGFASAWTRGDDWFLASLFVEPSAHGRGVGAALLDSVWDDDAARRRTITDAIQPVSNALYGRRGLVPSVPLLAFAGEPASTPPVATPEASLNDAEIAEIDAVAYGFDRAVDHAYWALHGRRSAWRTRDGIAYSYAFPGGALGPIGGTTPGAARAALAGELARADGPVTVRIPGSARLLVTDALAAGLRLSPTPGFLLLSERSQPPVALAIGGYTLF